MDHQIIDTVFPSKSEIMWFIQRLQSNQDRNLSGHHNVEKGEFSNIRRQRSNSIALEANLETHQNIISTREPKDASNLVEQDTNIDNRHEDEDHIIQQCNHAQNEYYEDYRHIKNESNSRKMERGSSASSSMQEISEEDREEQNKLASSSSSSLKTTVPKGNLTRRGSMLGLFVKESRKHSHQEAFFDVANERTTF